MVGDRILDMKCAADCGIPSVGCAYGYAASQEEFASASFIARSPEELPGMRQRVFSSDNT
jgi:phosphoglycolate phosphatase-like HAD superfamily hydrolase